MEREHMGRLRSRTRYKGDLLLVGPDPRLREAVCAALERAGFRAVPVAGLEEGIERVRSGIPFGMVLLELKGSDGWDFLRKMRREQRMAGVPVVILSEAAPPDGSPDVADWIRTPLKGEGLTRSVRRHFRPARAVGQAHFWTDAGAEPDSSSPPARR